MRLTDTQKKAIADLKELSHGQRKRYGRGFGKYAVALRALALRAPGNISYRQEDDGTETFALTAAGRFIECPGDHGEQCCGHFDECRAALQSVLDGK